MTAIRRQLLALYDTFDPHEISDSGVDRIVSRILRDAGLATAEQLAAWDDDAAYYVVGRRRLTLETWGGPTIKIDMLAPSPLEDRP